MVENLCGIGLRKAAGKHKYGRHQKLEQRAKLLVK
jgi:hypothetical protein